MKINFYFSKIDWIIIGAETGNRKEKIIPKKEWIKCILENAKSENPKIPGIEEFDDKVVISRAFDIMKERIISVISRLRKRRGR